MRNVLTILIVLVAGALCPGASFAADGTLTDDSYASVRTPNKNFGSDPTMLVEMGNANAFLKFRFSNLPIGVTGNDVSKATLKLWVSQVTGPGAFDVMQVNGVPTSLWQTLLSAQNAGPESWRS